MKGNEMTQWQGWKNIMKCYPFEESRLAKWEPPYIIQPKYDGDRCRAIPTSTGYILLSSEENIFFSVPHINEELNNLFKFIQPQDRPELDAELYIHGWNHESIHSVVSRTVNLHSDYEKMQLHVFDVVNSKPQVERLAIVEELRNVSSIVQVSPFWVANNLDELKEVYDKCVKEGYEGIIIRHFMNRYEAKRSTMIMKFKPKKMDKYRIVGWKEEVSAEGVPKGRIGSLIMSSQNGDEFGVSAGLDHEMKQKLWVIRDELIGAWAEVHYQHLTAKHLPKGTFNVEVIL